MKFLFIIFLLPLQLFAQDITGIWAGTLYNDTTKQYIKYELAISEYKGKLSGYSHTIFVIDSIENVGVKSVKIKQQGEKFIVEDEKFVYNNYTEPPAKGVKQLSKLLLSENDSTMILSGFWNTNRTKEYSELTGKIFLQKKKNIKESLIIAKLEKLGLTRSLSFIPFTPAPTNDLVIGNRKRLKSIELEKQNATVTEEEIAISGKEENKQIKDQKKNKKTPELALNQQKIDTNKPAVKITSSQPSEDLAFVNHQQIKSSDPDKQDLGTSKDEKSKTVIVNKQGVKQQNKNQAGIPEFIVKQQRLDNIKTQVKVVPPPAAEIATRKIETIRTVEIKQDSLLLTLYDNGEIDGDTVSILLNGKVIMPRQGLMAKAINKTIYLTPEMGDSIVLVMYAENLGSIPPNTGLLVVHDGDDVYEIRFSGDLQKNSAIILKRKKEVKK